jgi:hypothetical protein
LDGWSGRLCMQPYLDRGMGSSDDLQKASKVAKTKFRLYLALRPPSVDLTYIIAYFILRKDYYSGRYEQQ